MKKAFLFFAISLFYTSLFGQKENINKQSNFVERYLISKNCKGSNEKKYQKECTKKEIEKFVNRNLNQDIIENLPVGKHRVRIQFIIDTIGNITKIKSKSDFKALDVEFNKIFESIPKTFRLYDEKEKVLKVFTIYHFT